MSTKLTFREKVGYGFGDTASNFVWATLMTFLTYYYTDIFGISAAAIGTLFLFARVFDGFSDFLMGAIADRTKSKWGKFRPYLLWMSVPLAVTFVLTFTTPGEFQFTFLGMEFSFKLVWAWVTYNLMMIFYTAINIPYGALSGVMTDDPLDRTSLNSYRMGLAQVGGLIVNATTLPLIAFFGGQNDQLGYQITVIIFSIVSIGLFLLCFFNTSERIQPPKSQKSSLKEDLKTLFGNPHWVVLFICAITNMTFIIARASVTIHYFKYCLKVTGEAAVWHIRLGPISFDWDKISALLVAGSIFFILGASLTRFAVKLIGKKYAFIITMILSGFALFPYAYIQPDQLWLVVIVIFVVQIIGGINASLYWTMIADTADFSEWKFNVRNTGVVFSATTCSQKVGMALGGALVGYLLAYFGYEANVEQTERSLWGLRMLSSYIPGIASIVIACAVFFYGLDEKFCAKMREDLAQRRLARGESPPE